MKIYKDNHQPSSSNEKPHIWAKNKNVTNDGVVDAKFVINAPPKENTQQNNQHTINNTNPPHDLYQGKTTNYHDANTHPWENQLKRSYIS